MKTASFFVLFLFFSAAKAAEIPQIQLANLYREGIDPSDYLVSEKLDGVRARWDGKNLISRQGNIINAPQWFIENFPNEALDGELWMAHRKFEETCATVLDAVPGEGWKKIRFMVFDLPKNPGTFSQRYEEMKKIPETPFLKIIEQLEITSRNGLMKHLSHINKIGGEGLMLHKKNSFYVAVRNDDLLKLKTFEDAEAVVIAHIPGKGKYEGKLGALLVENSDKVRFKIGIGLTDKQRASPPKIGARITYKFYGKTKNDKPRFPSFMRERPDNS